MMSGRLLWIVLILMPFQVGVNGWRHNHGEGFESRTGKHHHHHERRMPLRIHERGHPQRGSVESQNNTMVITQKGANAAIKCYTHFTGDEMVTWTRWIEGNKEQLLTVGRQVYSSEARYSVTHSRHHKMWELSVRDVRESDSGLYECQMTEYPPASLFFTLKVVEARAVIYGGPDVHVHTGGHLKLNCEVQLATEPPTFIFWYHNGTMINYFPPRPLEVLHEPHSSSLLISNVTWDDAGWYTCEPAMAIPANLTLHVVQGEKHAALHKSHKEEEEESTPTNNSSPLSSPFPTPSLYIAAIVVWWGRRKLSPTITDINS